MVVVLVGILLLLGAFVFLPPGGGPGDACVGLPQQPAHYHAYLTITNQGASVPVPAGIGIYANLTNDHTLDRCSTGHLGAFSPLHTHEGDPGTIHIETLYQRDYTLGEFFRVWGQPLGPQQTLNMVAGNGHELHMYVNGTESQEWGNLVLRDKQQISVQYT